MNAEIISVGTELLLGEITDTNATWISQELQKIGLDVIYRTTVGDNERRIASVITNALTRVDVVLITGGLGPTVDDVTREAIAASTGKALEFHQVLLDQIADRFERFNVSMTVNNRRQAFAPEGALLIENPVGTAPIFILQIDTKVIMCLPGVPREMQYLFSNSLRPWLQDYIGKPSAIHSVTLRTAGIGESVIDAKIDDLMKLSNPTVGLAAHSGQTDIRITAKATNEMEAVALIQPIEADIRNRLGEWIYATGTEDIELTLIRHLKREKLSLAVVEIGTNSAFKNRVESTSLPYADQIVFASFRLNREKNVSEAAEGFAHKALASFGSSLAIATILKVHKTGITDGAIVAASESNELTRSFSWSTPRSDGPTWVTTQGMALLLRMINRINS